MKKISATTKQIEISEISVVLNNTALVHGSDGSSCLINTKTNQIVSEYGDFFTSYYSNLNIFIRKKYVKNSSNKLESYVTIYDADLEKSIFTNFIEIDKVSDNTLFILQNPKNSKYHILNLNTIKKASNQNLCNLEFDFVKSLYESSTGEAVFLVENSGKKGLFRRDYKNIDGTLEPIVYDDIKCINGYNYIFVFEKEGKSYFTYKNIEGEIVESSLYNKIEYDKNGKLLYCMNDNETEIYEINFYGINLLGKLPLLDKIECIDWDRYSKKFIVEKDEEYSVYGLKKSDTNDSVLLIKYTEKTYDKIIYKDEGCYLYKDGNVGFLYGSALMDAHHDDIKVINEAIVTIDNGICDIYDKTNLTEPVVSNCELIEICDYEVVFRKNGEYGIYYTSDRDGNSLLSGYSSITKVGLLEVQYNIYIVEEKGLKGVLYRGEEEIKPEYKSITCSPYESDDVKFFLLVNNKKTQLAKVCRYETVIYDSLFDRIEFYKDFYVVNAKSELRLYDYDIKLFKTLEIGVNISQINEADESKTRTYYDIDGVRYIYKYGSFVPVFIRECEYYITTFEMDEYIIEASSNIKEEHDAFCNQVDLEASSLEELKQIEARLTSLKTDYPSLTLKMTPKHIN